MLILTVLASECVLYPDGEEEPLLLPPIGGPGIPGILGTVFDDLASYIYTHTHSNTSLQKRYVLVLRVLLLKMFSYTVKSIII